MNSCRSGLALGFMVACLSGVSARAPAQDGVKKEAPKLQAPDLAKVKQEEAREKLERLEETMDRLSRLIARTEPQNAAKLRLAFREARDRLLREGMDKILKYLQERKLDRAVSEQGQVKINLEEILAILLEKDIDPRELLKHIRRLRDIVQGLDGVIRDETSEKMGSDDADQAGASSSALSGDLQKLEDLIRREKNIEKGIENVVKDPAGASGDGLKKLAPEQEKVRQETKDLRGSDSRREKAGSSRASPGEPPNPAGRASPEEAGAPDESAEANGAPPGSPPVPEKPGPEKPVPEKPSPEKLAPEKPGPEKEPPPTQPEPVLDKKALERAEQSMEAAEGALKESKGPDSAQRAAAARQALEEAVSSGQEKLERLRGLRDFKELKDNQETTRKDTDKIAQSMKEPPPLVPAPEGGVPGVSDVKAASGDMQSASQNLGGGEARKASRAQAQSLDKLKAGRQQVEETLEELQRAFRERLLAYLRERFTKMLNEQRGVTRETIALDLKLKALKAGSGSAAVSTPEALDRKDRQAAEALAGRESSLMALADDVLDLLSEDGTTLVFPGVVEEIKRDIANVSGLLSRIQVGDRTQYIERQIEASIEEILRALDVAQKSPPPPNPSQGRQSKSGAGPLLPLSTELKLVRSLQARVNERTSEFDLKRKPEVELGPEEKLQVHAIEVKQKDVEGMLRKLSQAAGER
jgi:hypothetical protein